MKTLAIVAIVTGLLLVLGIFLAGGITAQEENNYECSGSSCPNYGNGCTAQNNCGLTTCGAVSGTGSCGCGK